MGHRIRFFLVAWTVVCAAAVAQTSKSVRYEDPLTGVAFAIPSAFEVPVVGRMFDSGWRLAPVEKDRVFAARNKTFGLVVVAFRSFCNGAEFKREVARMTATARAAEESDIGWQKAAGGLKVHVCDTTESKKGKRIRASILQWFIARERVRYSVLVESGGRFRSEAFRQAQLEAHARIKAALLRRLDYDVKRIADTFRDHVFDFEIKRPGSDWRFRPRTGTSGGRKFLSLVMEHAPSTSRAHVLALVPTSTESTLERARSMREQPALSGADCAIEEVRVGGLGGHELSASKTRGNVRWWWNKHVFVDDADASFSIQFMPRHGLRSAGKIYPRLLESFRRLDSTADVR